VHLGLPAAAGDRAQALDVDPGPAKHFPDLGQRAGLVVEQKGDVDGHGTSLRWG